MVDIDSPCVRNCCLNEDDICLGCFRTLEEILQWSASGDTQRQRVLDLASERRVCYGLKYGGHSDNETP